MTTAYQQTLFGPSAPYRDVDTSVAAARAITPKLGSLHRQILDAIERCGTRTVDELCVSLALCRNTVAPRICELGPGTESKPGLNLIRDTGNRRKVPGQRVAATVWELNKQGG